MRLVHRPVKAVDSGPPEVVLTAPDTYPAIVGEMAEENQPEIVPLPQSSPDLIRITLLQNAKPTEAVR
jgi:hypothetical protein